MKTVLTNNYWEIEVQSKLSHKLIHSLYLPATQGCGENYVFKEKYFQYGPISSQNYDSLFFNYEKYIIIYSGIENTLDTHPATIKWVTLIN